MPNNDGTETSREIIDGKWTSFELHTIVIICVIRGITCQIQTKEEATSSLWEFITSSVVGFTVFPNCFK